jgi:hypothetical protein
MTARVLVTGSRAFTDRPLLWGELQNLLADHGALTVTHGACRTGADHAADTWARFNDRRGVTRDPWPANWRLGKRGGPVRNADMVTAVAASATDGTPVHVLAMLQPHLANAGTLDCTRKAQTAGLTVAAWWGALDSHTPGRPVTPEELSHLIETRTR